MTAVALELPVELWAALERDAAKSGVTLDQYMVRFLAESFATK